MVPDTGTIVLLYLLLVGGSHVIKSSLGIISKLIHAWVFFLLKDKKNLAERIEKEIKKVFY